LRAEGEIPQDSQNLPGDIYLRAEGEIYLRAEGAHQPTNIPETHLKKVKSKLINIYLYNCLVSTLI
jgi:hypothetical protein